MRDVHDLLDDAHRRRTPGPGTGTPSPEQPDAWATRPPEQQPARRQDTQQPDTDLLKPLLESLLGAMGARTQAAPAAAPARRIAPPASQAPHTPRALSNTPHNPKQTTQITIAQKSRLQRIGERMRRHPVKSIAAVLAAAAISGQGLAFTKGLSVQDTLRLTVATSSRIWSSFIGGEAQPTSLIFPSMDCTRRLATVAVTANADLHWNVNRGLTQDDVNKKNADDKITIPTESVELGKIPLAPIGTDPTKVSKEAAKVVRYPQIVIEEQMVINGCGGAFTPEGNSLVKVDQSSIGLSAVTDTSPASTAEKKAGHETFTVSLSPDKPSLIPKEELARLNKLTTGNDPRVLAAFRLAVLQKMNETCGVEIRKAAKDSIDSFLSESASKQGFPGIHVAWDASGDFQGMADMYKKNLNNPPVNPPPYVTADATFANTQVTCTLKRKEDQ